MMLHIAPPMFTQRRIAGTTAALSLFACFLLALAGHGLQTAPREFGKLAVTNRDAGTATLPRQAAPVRIASTSQREHAKSLTSGGALGQPCFVAQAILASGAGRCFATALASSPAVDVAHFARGPPAPAA